MCFLIFIPLFTEGWGVLYGLVDASMFSGSMCNLFTTPLLYESCGVRGVINASTVICFCGFMFVVLTRYLLKKHCDWRHQMDTFSMQPVYTEVMLAEDLEPHRVANRIEHLRVVEEDMIEMQLPYPTNEEHTVDGHCAPKNTVEQVETLPFLPFLPFNLFTSLYYYYLLSGMCIYGSLVFTFLGSRYLQDLYGLLLLDAGRLLLLPDAVAVVLSIPIGFCLEKNSGAIKILKRKITRIFFSPHHVVDCILNAF